MMELRFADLEQGENFAFVGGKAQTGPWIKTGNSTFARDLSDDALQFAVESLDDEVELLDQPAVCRSERITDLPDAMHEEGEMEVKKRD